MSNRRLCAEDVARLVTELPSGSEDEISDDEVCDVDPDWNPSPRSESLLPIPNDVTEQHDTVPVDAATTSGNIPEQPRKKRKKEAVKWYNSKSNTNIAPPLFLGRNVVHVSADDPHEYFLALFPEDLLLLIVYQTNLYASQCGRFNFGLTTSELKIFLGINILMTYIRYPRIRLYWSSEEGLGMKMVSENMSLRRFEEIRRYLHFSDNTSTSTDQDKAIKVRPVLNRLGDTFASAMDSSCHQSVDEMMIPFKGRSSLKQYIKSKPRPWGFKMWIRAGVDGYVHKFELYQGAKGGRPEASDLGSCGDVVWRLSESLAGKNHQVFFDNLFNSYDLLKKLKENDIHAVGTLRANRMMGAEKVMDSIKTLQQKGRGGISTACSEHDITVLRWLDGGVVHVASTFVGKDPMDTVKRWSSKEKKVIDVARPAAIKAYNASMGGVDLMDMLIATYRHSLKQKRWYMRIFWHMVNVCIANAWIIYKKSHADKDLLQFRGSIVRALINTGRESMTPRRPGRPLQNLSGLIVKNSNKGKAVRAAPEIRFDNRGGHWPKKMSSTFPLRCHDRWCTSKTRFQCEKCKEPVCPGCMGRFHTRY